jgi:hypothetical protein
MDIHDSKSIITRIYEFLRSVVGAKIHPVIAYALLTDQEVITLAYKHVLDVHCLLGTGMWEILPTIHEKEIKWWDLDLDW